MTATTVEPGRYLCFATRGFVPWVIREATRSEVDHAAIVLPPGNMIAEAEPGGVIVSPLSKYTGHYTVGNLAEPMTARQCEAVWAKAGELIGTHYNWCAIGEDTCDVLRIHWRWLLRLASTGHELDCSQMVAVCGHAASADWMGGKATVCEVTPGDLARRPGVVPVTIT